MEKTHERIVRFDQTKNISVYGTEKSDASTANIVMISRTGEDVH